MFRVPELSLIAMLLCVCLVQAADKTKGDDAVAKKMSKIAQLGPGPPIVNLDKKGRITSCIVVGQARIHTVLGKAKGLEIARKRARLDATARFVQFLRQDVSIYENKEDATIVLIKGSKENDKDAPKQSGGAVEKNSEKMEAISKGLVRGLQVLHAEQSDKDETFTLVLGWSAANAKAAESIEKHEGDKKDDPKSSDEPKKKKKKKKKKGDKKIEDKKTTSPDAKKFLP